jgi:tRNA 2-thiouridine synthesizing protein A
MTDPAPAIELDCRGLPCPRPIIELAKAFPGLDLGATIAVVADDVAAGVDIAAWCRMRGQEYAGAGVAADGVPTYLVRKVG